MLQVVTIRRAAAGAVPCAVLALGRAAARHETGFNNIFNRSYARARWRATRRRLKVGSMFLPGRYYEPAPGRSMYVGFSLAAGQ